MRRCSTAALLLLTAPALAEDTPRAADPHRLEELTVTAHPLAAGGTAQATTVLAGEHLDRQRSGTLGETVSGEPGVHTSSFGQGAGRPVIHGLGATRVGVMEDRIATLDASVTSDDHATTVEPFMADSIEILKGASTLLYGSGAIGGSVNVRTGRIPHALPEQAIGGRLEVRGDDVADQRTALLRLDGGTYTSSGSGFAWHLDAFDRSQDPYEIPGLAESGRLHALEDAEDEDHDEEAHGEDEVRGLVENSGVDTRGGAFGASLVRPWGFVGVAVSRYEAEYGLPGGGHAHGHEEENEDHEEELTGDVFIDLRQTRVDFETTVFEPLAGIDEVNLRLGHNNYRHDEVEGFDADGQRVVGTRFDNDAWDLRLEATHAPIAGWRGIVGTQISQRDFSAVGEEAFVTPTETDSTALYVLEERDFERFSLEAGARVEQVEHNPEIGRSRSFITASLSAGGILPATDTLTLRMQVDAASRAPVPEELYSDGPHLATQSFEIGDANLDEEGALNVALSADWALGPVVLRGTLYRTEFSDFIYRLGTGAEEDELPVRQWVQDDATFTGLDLVADWDAWAGTAFERDASLTVRALFDTVRARVDKPGGGEAFLPRTPPMRYGLSLDAHVGRFNGVLGWTRTMAQKDLATDELATSGYHDLRLDLATDLSVGPTTVTLFLHGRNLLDAEQRNHVSFLKDLVPRPGRALEGGVRVTF